MTLETYFGISAQTWSGSRVAASYLGGGALRPPPRATRKGRQTPADAQRPRAGLRAVASRPHRGPRRRAIADPIGEPSAKQRRVTLHTARTTCRAAHATFLCRPEPHCTGFDALACLAQPLWGLWLHSVGCGCHRAPLAMPSAQGLSSEICTRLPRRRKQVQRVSPSSPGAPPRAPRAHAEYLCQLCRLVERRCLQGALFPCARVVVYWVADLFISHRRRRRGCP